MFYLSYICLLYNWKIAFIKNMDKFYKYQEHTIQKFKIYTLFFMLDICIGIGER